MGNRGTNLCEMCSRISCTKTVGSATRQKIDEWWMRWHLTFMYPPMYRGHKHVWSTINSECVGCTLCGVVHSCSSLANIVPCDVEQQDDSSLVCTYTGVVVNSTSFYDPESSIADYNAGYFQMHVDTHPQLHTARNPSLQQKIEVLDNITANMIHLLFYSAKARHARDTERVRFNRKLSSVFTAHVSRSKNSFAHCNVVSGIEACIFSVASYRRPVNAEDLPPPQHFLSLQRVIVSLLSRVELPRQFIFSEQNEKMKNLVISLLYISSDGISFDGHVYLPKFPGLKVILPLELVLSKCFGIQPKIVTDGENVIKMSIKNAPQKSLHTYATGSPSMLRSEAECTFATTNVCTCRAVPEASDMCLRFPSRAACRTQAHHKPGASTTSSTMCKQQKPPQQHGAASGSKHD